MKRKKNEQIDRYNDPFPRFIRGKLEKKEYTQQMLADVIGVQRQTVSNYSLGTASPDINALSKYADYFNVSADYLLGRSKTTLKADDLQVALEKIDTQVIDRIKELSTNEADAGLRFINTLLNTDDFYNALVYLNKACSIQRLKDNVPSTQSNAYISAVKLTNIMESTKDVVMNGDDAIEYYTDKATKLMGEVLHNMVIGVKEKVDND